MPCEMESNLSTISQIPPRPSRLPPTYETLQRTIDPSVPVLPIAPLMCLPARLGRTQRSTPIDSLHASSFGDSYLQRTPNTIRFLFQNVKGLSSSSGKEDYRYYLQCLQSLQVDVAGLSETNTCWSHPHLKDDLLSVVRRYYRQSKVIFGSINPTIDPIPWNETFQAGGNVTILTGGLVSRVSGPEIQDPTGLGRWNGVTIQGASSQRLTILTAYRVCAGSINRAPLGSAFAREHNFFTAQTNQAAVNPRRLFFTDLQNVIIALQTKGHSVILMLDANATEHSDTHFSSFIAACSLFDLHSADPAPSTYIGAEARRIDYIFGCFTIRQAMTRSGTLSYDEGPQSDHRSLFADLDLDFLSIPQDLPSAGSQRVLHTGNPELVEYYNNSLLAYYKEHNMVSRIQRLSENYKSMSRADVRRELTSWDNDQGRAMNMSERRLSSPPKKFTWSSTLRNLAKTRLYWKLRLKENLHSANYTQTIQKWQRQIRVHDPTFSFPLQSTALSTQQIRAEFNKATAAFRKCQQQAIPMRMKCYEDLLEKYQDDTNSATQSESRRKAKIVRNTMASEVIRSKFRDIKRVVKPQTTSGLSKVLIPRLRGHDTPIPSEQAYHLLQSEDSSAMLWDMIVERDQIERHLLDYNRDSFRAASESPCGHGVIYDALTFSSLSPTAANLLEGEIPETWHKDDEALREFLASFTIPDSVKQQGDIPTLITEEDVVYGFRSWKESTSTSPSGRHLGHYRSLIQHPILLTCFVQFMNVAIQSGISIPRWSNAINVLIEKDSGKPKINRLRIIHLFEADLNFYLKLQWGHRLVRRALQCNLLHDGQHGSIPGRMALDPVMLTQLTTDLCRVLKHDFARFDNDASACYDRIIIALAMLAARKCGMPEHAIRVHADALRLMRYTVKTVYGISEANYQGTEFAPLFGTGQGSGASPSAWLSLVVILLRALDRLVPDRIHFSTSTGDMSHSRLSDAFVDDTYLGFTSSSDTATLESLVDKLQTLAQTWEHLLFLSGGKLNLAKCSWYVMRWEWQKGRPQLRRIQPSDPTLSLRQGLSSTQSDIPRTEIDTSQRMLGVLLNPLGDFSAHLESLKRKATTFAQRLQSPRLSSSDVRIFHRSTYIPSMRYGLAAVAIDEEALGHVQSTVIQAMLQKMHIQSTVPTSIRHGPLEFGGLDLYDLRTEAGLEAMKFFRDAIFSESENGKLLRLNLHYSQIEAGIGLPLLQHPEIHLPYLTPTWLMSMRQFLYYHNMSITITDDYVPTLSGPTDQYIMQTEHLSRYTTSQQSDLNLVRMYLQVHTLAEMTDPHRATAIALSYLDAKRPSHFVSSDFWPRQPTPTRAQSRLWKRFIRSSYLRYVPMWRTPPTKQVLSDRPTTTSRNATSYDTFQEYLNSLPTQHRRLLDGFEQLATDVQSWKAFRSRRRIHIATDGGLHLQKGTHGWVISTGTEILYHGSGPVDGPPDLASSTRSELAGYASVLLFLRALEKFWGLPHRSKFSWYCDSRSSISRVRYHASRLSRSRKMPNDSDLISIIRSCHQDLRFRIKSQWVKGHQDTVYKPQSLSLPSRLNIAADKLATDYRMNGRLSSSRTTQHESGQLCSFSINGARVTGQFDASIRFHINGYHLRQWLQSKHGWTDAIWEDIDFHPFGRHFRRLRSHRQATWMKFVHDQLPIGDRRYRQATVKEDSLRLCPCCKTSTETKSHLLRCPTNPSFLESQATLRNDLCSRDSHAVCHLINTGLHHHLTTPHLPFAPCLDTYPSHMQSSLHSALKSQSEIGWKQAWSGFMSKHWRDAASMAMFDTKKSDSDRGTSRMTSIITGIHDYSIRLWTARNAVLHSKEDSDMEKIRSAEAAEIRSLHGQPHALSSADRYLCTRSLSSLLDGAPSTRRRWLQRVKLSRAKYQSDGARQSLITTYFHATTAQT